MKKILLLVLILSACSRSIPVQTVTIQRDSIVYRDSLVPIEIPADSAFIQALIECDSSVAYLRQIIAYRPGQHTQPPQIVIKDNVIYAKCVVDEFAVYSKWRSKEVYRSVDKTKVYVKITNHLTGFQKWEIRGFWMLLSAIAIFLIWKYRKTIMSVLTQMPFLK